MNWQISQRLYDYLSTHCSVLVGMDLAGEETDDIEEELSYLLMKLRNDGRVKPEVVHAA
jgi:hypothetical protein